LNTGSIQNVPPKNSRSTVAEPQLAFATSTIDNDSKELAIRKVSSQVEDRMGLVALQTKGLTIYYILTKQEAINKEFRHQSPLLIELISKKLSMNMYIQDISLDYITTYMP
ncbi:unnamed protein product, partial [Didymodactylos carnosus]